MAERTGRALELLRRQSPGADRKAYEEALRLAIDRTARQYAFDHVHPAELAAAMRYCDEAMAPTWWSGRSAPAAR